MPMAAKIYITLTLRIIQSSKGRRKVKLVWCKLQVQRVQEVKIATALAVILTCSSQEFRISTPVVSCSTPTFAG